MAPTLPQKRTSGGNLHTFFRKGLTNLLHKEKSLRAITMYADRVSLMGMTLPDRQVTLWSRTMESTWAMDASSSVIIAPGLDRGVSVPSSW